jgi:hypothetical protein
VNSLQFLQTLNRLTYKVKISLLQVVEAHRFARGSGSKNFLDKQLTDGGKVVSPTRWSTFTPQEDSWYSFMLQAESTPGP